MKDKKPAHSFDVFVEDISTVEDAGIIIPKDIVVVDFDSNYRIATEILNKYPTLAIKTTRGMHLYYKVPDFLTNNTKIVTAIGVKVDYKTGNNNKKALAVIKQKGVLRKIINTVKNRNEIPELPYGLYPLFREKNELTGLTEGDGRNNCLYKHILNILESVIQELDNVGEIVEFINNNVFEEPLLEKELVAIIKSAYAKHMNNQNTENKNEFWSNGKIDVHKLAEYITKILDVKLYNSFLYYKKGEKYKMNVNDSIFREIYRNKEINLKLKKSQDSELKHQLAKTAEEIDENQYFPVQFRNGFILDAGEIVSMSGVFTPFNLEVDYVPDAYDENVDKFIDWFVTDHATGECRKDLRMVLEELLGHILMTSAFPHKVFFLVANSGSNGKSTFLTMLSNFVGELGSALALEEFNKPENTYTLLGKIANLGDDIDANHIKSSRTFKTLAAGNKIMVKKLYEMPIAMNNIATLIFSCNEVPNFKDKSGGINRRLAIIPCDNVVTEIDLKIDQKLSTDNAKSYLLNLAIKGMKRIVANGGKLTESETVNNVVKDYIIENDSVLSFLEEFETEKNSIENLTTKSAYMFYEEFCEDSGLKGYSQNKFTRKLKELGFDIAVKFVKGKTQRVIVKKDAGES